MTTVKALLAEARQRLLDADIDDAGLDGRLLLQHASGLDHADIVANPDFEISSGSRVMFQEYLARRLVHEPISRILGLREFYGREFIISLDVLDPRADTETLIDLCLEHFAKDRLLNILDLGTGSGILAVTLAAELPEARVCAVDVSTAALHVAQENADKLGVLERCSFLIGDWFSGITETYDLMVSNPPYIESLVIEGLEPEVKNFDPRLALDGGADGLSAYRAIAKGCLKFLNASGRVVVEIGAGQETDVVAVFKREGLARLESRIDLGGHVRALMFGAALGT